MHMSVNIVIKYYNVHLVQLSLKQNTAELHRVIKYVQMDALYRSM